MISREWVDIAGEWQARCERAERKRDDLGTRWEWMCHAIRGEPVSEFAESFSEVREAMDLRRERDAWKAKAVTFDEERQQYHQERDAARAEAARLRLQEDALVTTDLMNRLVIADMKHLQEQAERERDEARAEAARLANALRQVGMR